MLSKLSAFVAGSLLALGVGSSGAGQVVSPRADMQHVLGEPAPWIVQVQGVLEDQFADHEKSSASQDATDSEDAAVCSGERDVIVDLADRIIALGLASNRTKERRFGT